MRAIYLTIAELLENNQSGVLCTIVKVSGSTPRHPSSKMLICPDGRQIGTIGGGQLEKEVLDSAMLSLQDGIARLLDFAMIDPEKGDVGNCGGTVEVFIEPILPPSLIVIVGGGHVGKAVAHLAKWLGYRVAISDDRPEFCTRETNPDADEYYPVPLEELTHHITITPNTYFVLTTRGSEVDAAGLPQLLETRSGYIGIIGSKKRWAETQKLLFQKGITPEQLAHIHTPIGLRIRAETPEEIAVSILAEIIHHERSSLETRLKDAPT